MSPARSNRRLQSLDRSGRQRSRSSTRGPVAQRPRTHGPPFATVIFCLIPARPSVADIEATVSTLGTVRAWRKPFAFVLNQTPIRGQRIGNAATSLGDEAALDLSDVSGGTFHRHAQ